MIEELEKEAVDRDNDVPKMTHFFILANPEVGLCGTPLTGKFLGGTEPVDCVVCAEIVKGAFR